MIISLREFQLNSFRMYHFRMAPEKQIIACIMCTKDRPSYVLDFLENIKGQSLLPKRLLIIDSSLDDETERIVESHALNKDLEIHFFKSLPGLPRQRNIGITKLLEMTRDPSRCIVAFLDDDVVVDKNYFKILGNEIKRDFPFSGITGQPENKRVFGAKFLVRKFFLMDSKRDGCILPSGHTTTPRAHKSLKHVDWMCGLSMNIPLQILEKIRFDENIRMYGEDIEMSIRLREFGPIYCSSRLRYQHRNAMESRQSAFRVTTYTFGIRWKMSQLYPTIIKKKAIIWSLLGSGVLDFGLLISGKNTKDRISRLLGMAHFLKNIIARKDPTEPYK